MLVAGCLKLLTRVPESYFRNIVQLLSGNPSRQVESGGNLKFTGVYKGHDPLCLFNGCLYVQKNFLRDSSPYKLEVKLWVRGLPSPSTYGQPH